MGMEDETVAKPRAHEVGMPIDTMSVEELEARIALLRSEIERLKGAIVDRQATRKAAEAAFKI
jgi:uncharacterized small protein (DUF1192 family)